MFQPNSLNTCILHNPSQVHFRNMCHTHGWPQHICSRQRREENDQSCCTAASICENMLVRFWCVIHENSIEFCVDFKSAVRNIDFPIAKLGEYIGDLYGHYAEPPKDQVCHCQKPKDGCDDIICWDLVAQTVIRGHPHMSSHNCAPCPRSTMFMLSALLTILALASCSLVSKSMG